MSNEFTASADLQIIRYSQVWEDHAILSEALRIGPDDEVLSICSAGCNALALLLDEPRRVVALDISVAQAALLELKLAAIRHGTHDQLLELLGVESGAPVERYHAVRPHLSATAQAYWDQNLATLREGIIHAGRLERYFRGFQNEHLAKLHPPEVIQRLLSFDDPAAQGAYFDSVVATPAFRAAFIAYFGRENLQSRGRDPAQFRHVSAEDVGGEFLRRITDLCRRIPLGTSAYMTYFFTGQLPGDAHRTAYLKRENFERLRSLLPRLEIVVQDLGQYLEQTPQGRFSKANLSDIFEYMSAEDTSALLEHLARRFRNGGRLAYWNLLVNRASDSCPASGLRYAGDEGRALHARDRIFFYGAFHIEEIVHP